MVLHVTYLSYNKCSRIHRRLLGGTKGKSTVSRQSRRLKTKVGTQALSRQQSRRL